MAAGAAPYSHHSGTEQPAPIELNAANKQEFVALQRDRSPIHRRNCETEQKGRIFDAAMYTSKRQAESQHFKQRGALPQEVTLSKTVPLQNQQQIGQGPIGQQGIMGTSFGAQSAQNPHHFASSIARPQTMRTFPPGLTPKMPYGALNRGLFIL